MQRVCATYPRANVDMWETASFVGVSHEVVSSHSEAPQMW